MIEKITRFDQKFKILCVLQSHKWLSTKLRYTSTYIFNILCISRQVQESKTYENPTSTSNVIYKTILLFCINCSLFVIHLNLKQLRFTGESRLI